MARPGWPLVAYAVPRETLGTGQWAGSADEWLREHASLLPMMCECSTCPGLPKDAILLVTHYNSSDATWVCTYRHPSFPPRRRQAYVPTYLVLTEVYDNLPVGGRR